MSAWPDYCANEVSFERNRRREFAPVGLIPPLLRAARLVLAYSDTVAGSSSQVVMVPLPLIATSSRRWNG
jgi:hypothetical protein